MQKSLSEAQLVVVELGAEWPSAALGVTSRKRRVLVQDESESPAAFAVRVGEQLNALHADEFALSSTVLACSERLDQQARGARAEIARAAANSLARHRGGELELVATDRNSGRSRPALSALVSELSKEWQGAAVVATLRFASESAEDQDAQEPSAEAKSRTRSRRAKSKDSVRRVA
ncbi:MAG: hypothetical protein ABIQ16_13390 [Polyangiaceae bacterium]